MQMKPASQRLVAALWFLAFVGAACGSPASGEPSQNRCDTPLVVEVKAPNTTAKLTGFLNGVEYDFAQLLRELSREHASCGQNRPIDVLVSDRRQLTDLYEVRGLVSKAGLANGRYYIVSSATGRMGEIMFGNVIPYPTAQGKRRAVR